MSKKLDAEKLAQTPYERLVEAAKIIAKVPKSAIPPLVQNPRRRARRKPS